MSDVPLAHKYSAETYDQALSNLVQKWKHEDGEGPIKYDEAAVGMDKSTVSVALKFLGEAGLLEVPKAGNYLVPEDVLRYRTKMGGIQEDAKRQVAARLDDYPLYNETRFMLDMHDSAAHLDELAEDVSGSAAVAAEQDELPDVKRTLRILAELGFLEIDDEDLVSIPADLEESESEPPGEGGGSGDDDEAEGEAQEQPAGTEQGAAPQQTLPDGAADGSAGLTVDMDIAMDVTDMEPSKIREKLEAINGALAQE